MISRSVVDGQCWPSVLLEDSAYLRITRTTSSGDSDATANSRHRSCASLQTA